MQNSIKVLLGLLIVIAGIAYWVAQDTTSLGTDQQKSLIPSWQDSDIPIAAIDKIVLQQDQQQLTLIKKGQMWRFKDGFYVSPEPLFELIQSLRNAEIKELKTANPDKHAQLELADNDLSVQIYQGEQIQHVIHIGKTSNAGLTFVRHADKDQTYAVTGISPVSLNADNWLMKTVLDIDPQTVIAVSVDHSEGEAVEVSRNIETGAIELLDIPAVYQLKTNSNLQQLMTGLSRLMIDEAIAEDALSLTSEQGSETTQKLSITYELTSGVMVKLNLMQSDESYYLAIDSDQYPHYQGWQMKIAEYKFNALNRQLSDFIEPVSDELIDVETEAGIE